METHDGFDFIPGSGRLPPGERRNQIVAAATALFWEKGYHGASMRDIGERVGMLKGSLYAHVSNKEEILLEIVSTTFRRFMGALVPVLDEPTSAEERCRHALRAHIKTIADDPGSAYMFFHEGRHLQGQPGAWLKDAQGRYRTQWEKLYQSGIESGEFRPDLDVEAVTLVTLSLADPFDRMLAEMPVDPYSLADRFSDTLLVGCLAAGRSRTRSR